MADSPDRRAWTTQAAWIVAAAAVMLAVLFAVVAVRAAHDPVRGSMQPTLAPAWSAAGTPTGCSRSA